MQMIYSIVFIFANPQENVLSSVVVSHLLIQSLQGWIRACLTDTNIFLEVHSYAYVII